MNVVNIENQIVLITGASQGIGAEIARTFHHAGATVVINHPDLGEGKTRADAESLCRELCQTRNNSAHVVKADVRSEKEVCAMMQEVRQKLGGIHFLVNNAAILRDKTIAKMSSTDWSDVIDINLSGVFLCCKYGLEIMHDHGAIVSLGSIAAIQGFYGQSNYAAAKAGVQAMMRVLSRECARRGIRANAIAPGVIETEMAASIPESVRAEMVKNVPLRRFGKPKEIASVALFLCSSLASYVNGQTIEVNGGWRG